MNCSSIVAYGNDTRGLQQDNELLEQFFAGSPFLRVVLPVSKRISGFMRVKGKDVPEEDASINVFQHAPYDRCSSLGYSASYSRPLCDQIEIPSLGVLAHVNVISQGYHAMLDSDKRWYLGSLAGLLKKWYALGHQGVAGSAIAALRELRLKGNQKGVAVSTMDPHDGPFTDIELESIQVALNRAYAAGALSTDDYLLSWLFMLLGQRPAQYALLKLSDFTVLEVGDGSLTYCLNVPRVKQRKPARLEFRERLITPQIGKLLHDYANEVRAALEGKLGDVNQAPLFPGRKTGDQPVGMEYHRTGQEVANQLVRALGKLKVYSERTGNHIHITATRFRRTLGTRAAVEGHGELIIAELLDHTDTQNVGVYVQATPEIIKRIDRAVAMALAPMAQAFAGVIIPDESKALRNGDPSSRVFDPRIESTCKPMGSCGSHGYCGFSAPIACYTCQSFQAWADGPHEAVLGYLLAERERKMVVADERIASINDRTILAVAEVVRQCQAKHDVATEDGHER